MSTAIFKTRKNYGTFGEVTVRINGIKDVLNLGAGALNQSKGNVPARYQLYPLRMWSSLFGGLPTPDDAGYGARVIITDITDDEFAVGFGGTVTQGSGVAVGNAYPCWSNSVNWVIG